MYNFKVITCQIILLTVLIIVLGVRPEMANAQFLENIRTDPPSLRIGDTFTIAGHIVNNSPDTMSFPGGPYGSPLSIEFRNSNVVLEHQPACSARSYTFNLEPGKDTTIIAPGCGEGIIFKAANSGQVTAIVTFTYQVQGQTKKIANWFVFTIT